MVAFLPGQVHQLADPFGDEALVLQAELEGLQRGGEVVLRPLDGEQVGAAGGIAGEVEETLAVGHLLQGLHPHPAGETGQVLGLEITGHGHVQVGREEFVFHLFVESVLQFWADHAGILLGVDEPNRLAAMEKEYQIKRIPDL